ncbi:MAG: AAA family ATPase [Deltaproteobacteria bacterium]|nr:AAA family ATPase [Deltaproteobacteria bacterium]
MKLATLAISEQEALVRLAAAALRELELDADGDVVDSDVSLDGIGIEVEVEDFDGDARRVETAKAAHRLLTARLSGAAVARRTLDDMRTDHGEDALLVALSAVSDALIVALKGVASGDKAADEKDVAAVLRARADTRQLLVNPADMPASPITTVPQKSDARSAVAAALDSMVDGPALDDLSDQESVTTTTALLRIRAFTAEAARSLAAVAAGVVGAADVVVLGHAADELLLSAGGADVDAVAVLVRAATTVAQALPEGAPLSFSLVKGSGDVVGDVVRAGALLPAGGLLAFDDEAFLLAGDLACVPGAARVVDPRAAWGQERWELSALLMRPPFVGRDDDVKICSEVLAASRVQSLASRESSKEAAAAGSDVDVAPPSAEDPRLLVLWGPAGIGKSSLVRASLSEAGLLDERAVVLWGAADPLQPTPYAAIVGMIRALARAPAGHPRAAVRVTRLVTGLADSLPAGEGNELRGLAPVVVDLLGAGGDDDDDDVAERRSPRALRTSIRRAVLLIARALLARAGDGRPAVFVVSGAEAMDTPTRETLAFVARRLGARARLVLLASSKPKLPPVFEEGLAITRHEVKPLDEATARGLCNALLDVNEVSSSDSTVLDPEPLARAVKALFERAKGSPLFVAHAVRWAVEGGYLKKSPGVLGGSEWDASLFFGKDVDGRLPTRLDKLLHGRVMRLPDDARRVLGHCAALGLTFMPAAVEFVGVRLGIGRDEVARAVRQLSETGFLARSQRRPGAPVFPDDHVDAEGKPLTEADDALLAFEHPLLRAAAEQALAADEAVAVHGVVADALEALLDTRAVAPMLARHHKMAGRRRQAVSHLVTAVRRARRLDDRQGAITMANEALELCTADEKETIFTLQLELCAVLEQTANQKGFKEALKQLVRAADKTGDPHRQSTAFSRVARFNLFTGDVPKAEEAALRALEKARAPAQVTTTTTTGPAPTARPSTRAARDVLRLLALIRFSGRDLDGAHRALEEARRLTPADDRRVTGVIEHQTGLFRLESNDPLGALEHLLVAHSHKRATVDLAGEAACLDAIADVYIRTGRLWTALSLLVRALSIRESIGDDAGFAQSLKNRADVLLMAGDVEAAKDGAQRARALAKGLSLDRLEHQAAIVVARTALAQEDASAAEAILDNVRRRVDDKRDPFGAMEAELLSARAKWLRAQQSSGAAKERLLKTALARARAAVDIGEQRGFLSGQVLGNALLGDVLVSSGDVGRALPYAQRAAELLDDRTATGLPVEDALGAYARVLRAVGDDDEADAAILRARGLLNERARRLPPELQERFWSVPARRALRGPMATSAPVPEPPSTSQVPEDTQPH